MATARFFLVLVLVTLGCALLICANEPRPVVARWVGGGVHASTVVFFGPTGYSTGFNNHDAT